MIEVSSMNAVNVVSLIIPYNGGLVLARRNHEPFAGRWAFPSGHLRAGEETFEEAVVRELKSKTGLVTDLSEIELVFVQSSPLDPSGMHILDHMYEIRKYAGTLKIHRGESEIRIFARLPEEIAEDHLRGMYRYLKSKPSLKGERICIFAH